MVLPKYKNRLYKTVRAPALRHTRFGSRAASSCSYYKKVTVLQLQILHFPKQTKKRFKLMLKLVSRNDFFSKRGV